MSVKNPASNLLLCAGVLEKDCTVSPFCFWNMVRLPYCDGSTFSGTQTKTAKEGYIACGHFNAAAALATLMANSALPEAARVIVSGGSAGGIGAFRHADYIRSLPQLRSADVRAVPLAGWFFPNVTNFTAWEEDPTAGTPYHTLERMRAIWTDDGKGKLFFDESCTAAHKGEEYLCGTMDLMYQYIDTPLFAVENQFDYEQLLAS